MPTAQVGVSGRDGENHPRRCVSARSAEWRGRVARSGDLVLGDVRLASEALSLGHRIRAVILDGVACTRGRINVVLLELVRLRPIELLRSRIKRAAVVAAAARERDHNYGERQPLCNMIDAATLVAHVSSRDSIVSGCIARWRVSVALDFRVGVMR